MTRIIEGVIIRSNCRAQICRRTSTVIGLIILIMTGSGCKSTQQLQSHRSDRVITVDGNERDWEGAITPIKGKGIALGLANDDTYLYLAVISSKEALINQIRRTGLTLWFDPNGGTKKVVGIRYPLGLMSGRGPGIPPPDGMPGLDGGVSGRNGTPGRNSGNQPPDDPRLEGPGSPADNPLRMVFSEVEIVNDGGDRQVRLNMEELDGLQLKAALDRNALVYELRIPLSSNPILALNLKTGSQLGLGIIVPEIDYESMQGPPGGRESGGGPPGGGAMGGVMPGGGGMPAGGGMPGGGPPGGMRPGGDNWSQQTSLNVWAHVILQ